MLESGCEPVTCQLNRSVALGITKRVNQTLNIWLVGKVIADDSFALFLPSNSRFLGLQHDRARYILTNPPAFRKFG